MFGEFLEWAGTTGRDDRGPGGGIAVSWPEVRIQLRNPVFSILRLGLLIPPLGIPPTSPTGSPMLTIGFQWIHPFKDTNGRTGRVLDHYILPSSGGGPEASCRAAASPGACVELGTLPSSRVLSPRRSRTPPR